MPRSLQIPSLEMGIIHLYLIYSYADVWEEEWRDLQGSAPLLDLPEVDKSVMDDALIGWTKPLVNRLGPPPKGKLLKLPKGSRTCANRSSCPLYDKTTCGVLLKRMPWCFEPDGIKPGPLAAEIVKLWRDEVYVVVVKE